MDLLSCAASMVVEAKPAREDTLCNKDHQVEDDQHLDLLEELVLEAEEEEL